MADNVEAEVIKQSIPDLVLAVTDHVTAVSDECLAKGLITESTSRRTLDQSAGTREERARYLVHSVHGSIKSNSCCFEIFLEVLSNTLPERVKEKVVADLRKELTDQATTQVCKAVIPVSQSRRPMLLENRLQCLQQQSSFLEKYESSVSRHASASTQKSLFEETLQSKINEISGLRVTLDSLSHSDDTSSKDKEIQNTKNRLSACETEVSNLRGRIEELECVLEEESMQARRGRSTIRVETKRLLEEFARQNQHQLIAALQDKEEEYKRSLAEKEAEIRRQMQEEIKDLKHKVVLQEKELKIKELELNNATMKQETKAETDVQSTHDPPTLESGHLLNPPVLNMAERSKPKLKYLLRELIVAASDWENIGIELDLKVSDLKQIKLSNHLDSKACLREMLSMWLRQYYPHPSWSAIVEALHNLGYQHIADRITTTYMKTLI